MLSKTLVITNETGFHMRPATLFTQAMAKYESDVAIKYNGNDINGKSIMHVMAACMKKGAEIEVVCSGPDEQAALDEAEKLINSGLGDE